MTFVAGQTLTAAQLNDLDIDSLVVDTDVLVVDKTNDRVGIGTTTPAEELHMLKDQDGVLTQMMIENLDQRLRVGAYYEAGVNQYSKIQSEADNGSDQRLALNPEGGNVGIGTTTPGYTLDVTGPQDTASRVNITSGDTANRYLMRFSRNGSLFTQGVFCDTVNASFGTPSDANLKTAVESLDTAEALAAITALRAVSYRYLLDTDDVVRKGFIAQEVDEIIPEAVHRVGGGHPTTRLVPDENGDLVATDVDENGEPLIQEEPDWLMTYEAITTTLVAAVQAQQQVITDLERRVAALEA